MLIVFTDNTTVQRSLSYNHRPFGFTASPLDAFHYHLDLASGYHQVPISVPTNRLVTSRRETAFIRSVRKALSRGLRKYLLVQSGSHIPSSCRLLLRPSSTGLLHDLKREYYLFVRAIRVAIASSLLRRDFHHILA